MPSEGTADTAGDESSHSRRRVLDAATVLFAERGYDGTSTREIGRASGLNIATVAYHVGSKQALYRTVMRQAFDAEHAALAGAVERFRAAARDHDSTVTAAVGLVSSYLDFCLANPHIPALWMRRWLSDAADIAELEATFARPLAGLVHEALQSSAGLADPAVDLEMALWTVTWSIHGFCCAGVLDAEGVRRGRADEPTVARYRTHLSTLVTRLLTPGSVQS